MQEDLDADHPNLSIEILSINQIGAESGANSLSSDMDLPMVQDTTALYIWNSWGGDWRDVWILDENNSPYAVVNLTTYGLSTTANYNGLKELFVGAAQGIACADVQHGFDPSVCQ